MRVLWRVDGGSSRRPRLGRTYTRPMRVDHSVRLLSPGMRRTTIFARAAAGTPWWVWAAIAAAVLAVVSCVSVPLLVLRPGSRISTAEVPYPAPAAASVGVVAQLRAAPLILDRRLRVFATQNDVWAEPLTAPDGTDSYWSYHRWPAEVVGVVAFGAAGTAPPVVVVKWSDGLLVALRAEHGDIAWTTRVQTKDSDQYWGRRTGTHTVYGDETLFSLYSARSGSSRVVISSGDTMVDAFDPISGRQLWSLELPTCHGVDWTGEQVFATILVLQRAAHDAHLRCRHRSPGRHLGATGGVLLVTTSRTFLDPLADGVPERILRMPGLPSRPGRNMAYPRRWHDYQGAGSVVLHR